MALSGAERQARHRAKRDALALKAGVAKNGLLDVIVADRIKRENLLPKERRLAVQLLITSADPAEDAELVAWLEAIVAPFDSPELVKARKEIERLRNAAPPPPSDSPALSEALKEIERLRSEVAVFKQLYERKQTDMAARKAKMAAADAAKAEMYADDDRAALIEKLVQADKQLMANKTRIKNVVRRLNYLAATKPPMTKRLYRQVLASLHPDRAGKDEELRQTMTKYFQEFSAVKFTFPPDDDVT